MMFQAAIVPLRFFPAFAALVCALVAHPALSAVKNRSSIAEKENKGPDWMLLVSPTGGWLRNATTFPVPVGRDAENNLIFDEYKTEDDGFGGGITLMGYYKRLALTNVFFGFPEVNHASLLGSITYLSFAVPTGIFVEPYVGVGFVAALTDARWFDFSDVRIDDLGGLSLKGFARMDTISVRNRILAPFPKVGVKFHLPLQHWYVQPFYSYMYEHVRTDSKSTGGSVELWECADQNDPHCEEITGDHPVDKVLIRAFDKTKNKEYQSHLVGIDFFLDFHYFVQLRGKVYYNVNHNLWTFRLIGSVMLSKNMGITAFFEHSQKITVTNTYVLLGPAFLFSPPGFMDKMAKRRQQKRISDETP